MAGLCISSIPAIVLIRAVIMESQEDHHLPPAVAGQQEPHELAVGIHSDCN